MHVVISKRGKVVLLHQVSLPSLSSLSSLPFLGGNHSDKFLGLGQFLQLIRQLTQLDAVGFENAIYLFKEREYIKLISTKFQTATMYRLRKL